MSFRIEHRVGVAAPPAEVWELVRDLDGWKDWTELYTEASGRLAIGETLTFTFKLGDRAPQTVTGRVYDWVPEAQMAWHVRFIGAWLRSLRYVEIEKLSDTSCILANGDYYSGPLTFLISRKLRSAVRAGFQRMNENAKRIVEERWTAKGGTVEIIPDPEGAISIGPLLQPTSRGKMWGMGGAVGGFGPRLQK